MKLDCVLTATNTNPTYCQFIPIFVKMWNKLLPEVDVKIVMVSDKIPDEYKEYSNNIILFPPIDGMKTEFISQYIRLLYPSILNYENGVLITDMDMLPMNSKYYVDNIKDIPNDKFIYYRNVLLGLREIAMCYNVAIPKIWGEVFEIKELKDIYIHLKNIYDQISYDGGHGKTGWNTDQLSFFYHIVSWHSKTNNFIYLEDRKTGYNRLDRGTFVLNDCLINQIKSGYFSDYHALRPYSEFKEINDKISDLIS